MMPTYSSNGFRERLNELFARSPRRLTNKEVVDGLLAQGFSISVPYLSQIRTGVRGNPSNLVVAALADYFDVDSEYFYLTHVDENSSNRYEAEDAAVIAHLHATSTTALLTTANGLSDDSHEILIELAEKLRLAERHQSTPNRHRSAAPTVVRRRTPTH